MKNSEYYNNKAKELFVGAANLIEIPEADIRELQGENNICKTIKRSLENQNKKMERKFQIINEVIYKKPNYKNKWSRVVLPRSKFDEIYESFHIDVSEGHFGIEKTSLKLNQIYWHPELNKWVKEKISKCLACQKNKCAKLIYEEPHEMPV